MQGGAGLLGFQLTYRFQRLPQIVATSKPQSWSDWWTPSVFVTPTAGLTPAFLFWCLGEEHGD